MDCYWGKTRGRSFYVAVGHVVALIGIYNLDINKELI